MINVLNQMKNSSSATVFLILIGLLSCVEVSIGSDTLTLSQSLVINETLVSQQGRFQLGFFSPGISNRTYLGTVSPDKVVWVANGENPLTDTSGVLCIVEAGNLLILDKSSNVIWSTNLRNTPRAMVAQLLDSGNLMLRYDNGSLVWQSFDHPSHAMIPGMKLGYNSITGLHLNLVSWKSSDDPSPGEYTYGVDTIGQMPILDFSIWKGSSRFYRSGPWNRVSFGEVYIANDMDFTINVEVEEEDAYIEYSLRETTSFLMATISDDGVFQLLLKENKTADWRIKFTMPQGYCNNYMRCGPNSVCTNDSPYCSCMTGYTPKNPEEWDGGVWSGGCIWNNKEEYAKNTNADAYILGEIGGCFLWFADLVDVAKLDMGSNHLFIRAPSSDQRTASDLERHSKKKWKIPVIAVAMIASIFLPSVLFFIWTEKKGGRRICQVRDEKNLELPSYDIVTIEKATQSFSDLNKIGEGGFGPVYKGKLSWGEEIAVKRLSETSCEGVACGIAL